MNFFSRFPKAFSPAWSGQTAKILASVCLVLLLFTATQELIYNWEVESLTIRQKLFSAQPKDRSNQTPLTLVVYDYKSFGNDTYKRIFDQGFSRKIAAYVVRFLQRSKAKAVGFDLSFNGGTHYDSLAEDQALVDSLKNTSTISSQLFFDFKQDASLSYTAQSPLVKATLKQNAVQVNGIKRFPVYQSNFNYASLVPPFPLILKSPMPFFAANAFVYKANLNLKNDSDSTGEARRWTPFAVYGPDIIPTLSLGLLLHGQKELNLSSTGRLSWPGGSLDLGFDGVPLIKWYGHGTQLQNPVYPEVSFSDVVLSELILECAEGSKQPECHTVPLPKKALVSPEIFNNRYVLVGFNVPNQGDVHKSIHSPKYPGLYIVANILDNALNNDFVHPAPLWLNLLFCLLLPGAFLAATYRFKSTWMNLLIATSLAVGQFLLCYYVYAQWNLWLYLIYPILAIVVCFSGSYVYRYVKEARRREQLRFAFGKYVAPKVLEIIEKHPEKVTLGGERRDMTFLFTDIRGFTSFSDQNPPEVVQKFLTQYFSTMNGIIMHGYQGSINKLMGDAIMAYWGFPLADEDHAFLAVSAALAMREAMLAWGADSEKLPMTIGIGINTGEAMVGNIGSEDFMDFTVIGDAVNVASRLEGVNKEFGTTIIISAATYERIKDRIKARRLGWVELKGKGSEIEAYEPLELL